MEWSSATLWVVAALALGLAELFSGGLVLLALALAAALTAGIAATGVSVPWQIVAMGLSSGILVPIFVWKIHPRFSPKGVRYGTTGSGVERGQRYTVQHRDYDGASVICVNNDLYRVKVIPTGDTQLETGTYVILNHFDGTTAMVYLAANSNNEDVK